MIREEQQHRIESVISTILRGGVLLSMAIIVTGLVVTFAHHHDYFSSRPALGTLIDARQDYAASFGAVLSGIRELRGQAIVMLGVLVLIATPVIRVAASIVLFAAQRDRLYVLITITVLLLLLASFVIGGAA